MYPHGEGVRRRRVGQPPLAPQHLMGIAQQGPGVIMPMPNPPVQILQQNQHHYSSQPSYQNQPSSTSYVTQGPPPSTAYHQQPQFSHANTQVVLTKQAVNHSKHYREEYKVVSDQPQGNYTYRPPTYNGQHPTQSSLPTQQVETSMAHPAPGSPEKDNSPQDEESASPDSTTKEITPIPTAGVKEKTPMCLVNELARFNKISHQYRLTNEQGPAHKKSFTVTLTLGTEDYTAEGPSIKKAQHAAAADALSKTSYSHPTPKHNKHLHIGKSNMTPTVELNALAMKRGEPAIYKLVDPPLGPVYQPHQTYTFRRPYGIRGGYYGRGRGNCDMLRGNRMPIRPTYAQNFHYTVSLKVGAIEFTGEGNSPQAARHDAAAKALAHLRLLPLPETAVTDVTPEPGVGIEQDLDSCIKSPISLVHEIALKRNLNVVFSVLSEKGPPHMKTFITECFVGEFRSEGEGNGKKISKKRAAENMLQELKKLPPLSPSIACSLNLCSKLKRKPPQTKKKTRNLIKLSQEQKPEVETTEEMNPISRLIQIQQVRKEREPVYTLIEEKGVHRRREFVIEVAIGQMTAVGSGPNKKVAKKYAAQNLLALIEGKSGKPESTPNSTSTSTKATKTEVKQEVAAGSSGRQLVPGLLLVPEQQTFSTPSNDGEQPQPSKSTQDSPTTKNPTKSTTQAKDYSPKDHLIYLGNLLDFEVVFSDYPKSNHKEHLTLVSLSTIPPQVCHGSAATIEDARNQAAVTALRALSEMGLDQVSKPVKDTKLETSGKDTRKK